VKRTVLISWCATLALAPALAQRSQPGEVRKLDPAWALAGKTTTVKVTGQDLPGQTVAFETAGVTGRVVKVEELKLQGDEARRKGNTLVEVELTVPAGARPGPHAFTLGAEGNPR
jgi:hypothetical protein